MPALRILASPIEFAFHAGVDRTHGTTGIFTRAERVAHTCRCRDDATPQDNNDEGEEGEGEKDLVSIHA